MMTNFLKPAAVATALLAVPAVASAAVVSAGPGGFDAGWATGITYEDDNAVARRGVTNDRDNALNALGAADGDFFELGFGSTADFTFGTLFDSSVTVFEITFGSAFAFPESIDVAVGYLGVFTSLGSVGNTGAAGGITVSGGAGVFDTVRFTDTSPLTSTFESDALGAVGGFDVDAVRVSPVPVPAAGLLLLAALGGMASVRRRRKS